MLDDFWVSLSVRDKKHPENFIKREVTIDTVMGVLNRLIGDQRKLYQAREDDSYFFKNIDTPNHPLVKFDDLIPKKS